MTKGLRFVGSRALAGLDPIRIDDQAVIEADERLRRVLRRCYDASAVTLFAEPVLSRSNGSAAARIDWYTSLDGPVQPYTELDPDRAVALRERIRAILSAMEPVLRDPEDGPFLAACLNLASPAAIVSVGGVPLFIDWGLLPHGLARDEHARARHHAQTVDPVLPAGLPSPPIGREDWELRFGPRLAALDASARVGNPLPAPALSTSNPRAPAVAAATAALLLALSYMPGVLVFPQPPRETSTEARALQTAWLDSLRRRREVLAQATDFACPRLRTELPTLVPQSPAGIRLGPQGAANPQARAAIDEPLQPASPDAPRPPGGGDLVERLERSTVLVLAGDATGSGFFISPDLVVTNRHVVERASSLLIAGRHVGVLPATLVRTGGAGDLEDFALLRVPHQTEVRPLSLAVPGRPLTPVVAAGFPGLYLGTDPTFARLREGDAAASRSLEPVFQTGVINHLQRYDAEAVTLVLHGAEIAPGNSGGPLVDYCGRVVGVNSFGRTDAQLPVTARYALGADGLSAFLTAGGVAMTVERTACDLQTAPRATVAANTGSAPALVPPDAGQASAAPVPPSPAPARSGLRTGRDARQPAR